MSGNSEFFCLNNIINRFSVTVRLTLEVLLNAKKSVLDSTPLTTFRFFLFTLDLNH